jgi:hypoxanthine-DNA glycosylase
MPGSSLRGFPPVIDSRIRTLVLGSFPSVRSLARGQYYGHPQNQFWRLVGRAIGEPLYDLPYQSRLDALLAHRIGLWDVIGTCERQGSLDQSIRRVAHNPFDRVLRVAAELRCVCFNGKTAAALEPWFAERGYMTFVLPSSSPANTVPFPAKFRAWRRALTAEGTGKRRSSLHRSLFTVHGFSC